MMIETKRLILREMTLDDQKDICNVVADPETMKFYRKEFLEQYALKWITWNLDNYKKYGFGLWAIILKETGELIGDCGITIQRIDGELLPEIGYHIHKNFWRQGYGKEAAAAVRDWGFNNTKYDCLYSYMTSDNVPSYSTAASIGMKKIKEYLPEDDEEGMLSVYAITKQEWELLNNNN